MSQLDCMEDLLNILHQKDYIKTVRMVDSIFILARYDGVFNKILETAKEHNIFYRAGENYNQQINPKPFDNIGPYNIALYDIEEINNIFNSIEEKASNSSMDEYDVAYHYNSGIYRRIRRYSINNFRVEMNYEDYNLLIGNVDGSKITIADFDRGALGGFPVVLTIENVEQKIKDDEALREVEKKVDKFIESY